MGQFRDFLKTRRAEAIAKYGEICWLCDQPAPAPQLALDLVYPEGLGGTFDLHNLRLAHLRCKNLRNSGPTSASASRAYVQRALATPSGQSVLNQRIREITNRNWSAVSIRRAFKLNLIEYRHGEEAVQKWLRGESGPIKAVEAPPELRAAVRQAWGELHPRKETCPRT